MEVQTFKYYTCLPNELRHSILANLLTRSDRIDLFQSRNESSTHAISRARDKHKRRSYNPIPWPMNIFLVSKLFLHEAPPIFFRHNNFYLAIPQTFKQMPPLPISCLEPFLRARQSTSILRQGMRSLVLRVPLDRITPILDSYGNALTTMIEFRPLRSLIVELTCPEALKRPIVGGDLDIITPQLIQCMRDMRGIRKGERWATAAARIIPNTFEEKGLPGLLRLLAHPLLERAQLCIPAACHPRVLCKYHDTSGGLCEYMGRYVVPIMGNVDLSCCGNEPKGQRGELELDVDMSLISQDSWGLG
ncbi:unnamed protein product [Discula destructiva]